MGTRTPFSSAMKLCAALLLVATCAHAAPIVNVTSPDVKCCVTCAEPLEKYYSIDTKHNMCGECCMNPKDYTKYKLFEPGLTKATADNKPCADAKFVEYDSTVTHGFGPIKMTLDLYKPPTLVSGAPTGTFCGGVPFIISMNMTVHDDSTFDYHNNVKVAHKTVDCTGEKFTWVDSTKIFDISKALADPNDCLAKAVAQDSKSKPTLSFDGTNVVAKNGYGTLKLKPCSADNTEAAPTALLEGSRKAANVANGTG